MKILFIFVTLSFSLCFQTKIKASCENAFFLHRDYDSHSQSGRLNFMEKKCLKCEITFQTARYFPNQKYCSRLCSDNRIERTNKGKGHYKWGGDNIPYKSLHLWINRNFGKATKCEVCGTPTSKIYEWASIGHVYTRDRKDWKEVCRSCHRKMDGREVAVYKLSDNGEIIHEYPSIKDAEKSYNVSSRISSAIMYRRKAVGFYWQRKSDYGKPFKNNFS